MNKKGFTLIEVLGVIVVLVFIVLITYPIVGNLIQSSRERVFKSSVLKIVEVAEEYLANRSNDTVYSKPYIFDLSQNILEYDNDDKIKSGKIIVGTGNHTIVESVSDGKYCLNGNLDNLEFISIGSCGLITNQYFGVKELMNKSSDNLQFDSNSRTYYYSGTVSNNYVEYADLKWRIVSINKNQMKLVLDSSSSVSSNYTNLFTLASSNFYKEKYDYIMDYDYPIGMLSYGNINTVNIKDIEAASDTKTVLSKVGALTVYEYLRAGGTSSFINNSSYTSFWFSNENTSANAYSYENGAIVSKAKTTSLKVRPVIVLKESVIISGAGSSLDPYVVY